jgi:hypothetical protein
METKYVPKNRNLNFQKFKFIAEQTYKDSWYCWQCYQHGTTGSEATMFWREKNEQGKRLRDGSSISNAPTDAKKAARYSQTTSIK